MKKKNILLFTTGLGIGTLVGFILRNSESTDYNAGYQPELEIFDEKDYFTDEIVQKHREEKEKRKQEKSEYVPRHAKKETVSDDLKDLAELPIAKKGKGYRGKTRTEKFGNNSEKEAG